MYTGVAMWAHGLQASRVTDSRLWRLAILSESIFISVAISHTGDSDWDLGHMKYIHILNQSSKCAEKFRVCLNKRTGPWAMERVGGTDRWHVTCDSIVTYGKSPSRWQYGIVPYFDRHLDCLDSANRSTFGSAPCIKVLNFQLARATWMNSYLYQVPGRRSPTPSSFPFKSTAELEIIYRFMEKSDSILVRNFGFENSTIPPSKWWQYVGLRTFKFSPCVPHPAVNNQRTRVLAILTEAPGSTSQKPSRCIWQMYFRLASFDTVHESVFTNSYKFVVSIT